MSRWDLYSQHHAGCHCATCTPTVTFGNCACCGEWDRLIYLDSARKMLCEECRERDYQRRKAAPTAAFRPEAGATCGTCGLPSILHGKECEVA